MFPHEAQETMAKILFFIFAALILSFSRVNAAELRMTPAVAKTYLSSFACLN